MRRLELALGALLVALGTAPVCAQGAAGTIRGRITAEGSPDGLAGVVVSFGNRNVLSRADGSYLLTSATPGTDTLRARFLGYAPARRAVSVGSGQTVVVDLVMTPVAVNLAE